MNEWDKQLKAFFGENTMEELKVKNYIESIDKYYDSVNKPSHYMIFESLGIEVRDVIAKLVKNIEESKVINFDPMDFSDYVQMMQYGMRFMNKGGMEDLKKMKWYLDKLIENYDDAN